MGLSTILDRSFIPSSGDIDILVDSTSQVILFIFFLFSNAKVVDTSSRNCLSGQTKMSLSLISIVKSLSSKIKHTYGWRVTILYSAIGTFVTLLLNVILLVLSLSRRGSYVGGGIITLFDGSCATSNYISTTSHILINFLSTTLLAASNLGMQCLLAPTREDVDNAHSRGSWLHIGVLSLKNLQGVPRIRRVVFTILSLSSMPLHFL